MLRLASVCVLMVTALPALAASTLSLDGWLRDRAAPQLAEVLAKHPRFKGERIRFVGVVDGRPTTIDNELTADIRRALTHRILKQGSNDVVGNLTPSCQRVGRRETYLVGINIRAAGSRYHEVNLAVMDVTEGIWVAGVSYNWRGRLSTAQRAALKQTVSHSAAGSSSRPLPLENRQLVVERLLQQMRCNLPQGVDGTVTLALPERPELQLLARELEQRLVAQPGMVLAEQTDNSNWQLRVLLSDAPPMPTQVVLALAAVDDPAAAQRVAQVTVSVPQSRRARSAKVTAVPVVASADLLSDFHTLERCAESRDRCAQVGFTLHDDAYVLVFRTHAAALSATSCTARQERRMAGELQFRVQVAADTDTRTGFYVIASRDREVIRELERLVRRSSSACSTRRPANPAGLLAAMERLQPRLQWRAMHLTTAESSAGFRRL